MLVDPFLAPNNPAAKVTADERRADPHPASPTATPTTSPTRSRSPSAPAPQCVAIVELASWLERPGRRGRQRPEPRRHGRVRLGQRQAGPGLAHQHDRPTAHRDRRSTAGLVIKIGGKTVYHLGDTCLFGDLKLIARAHPRRRRADPDRRPLHDGPPRRRRTRCELIGAATVIPCHYNTFPQIETDAEAFKAEVESTAPRPRS